MDALPRLTPDMLVMAYRQGIFPMARSRRGRIDWYSPDPRAVMPLDRFHAPRSLRRRVKSGAFHITHDAAFAEVIAACAAPRPYARQTWINDQIVDACTQLHQAGAAHSIEAWATPDASAAPPTRSAAGPQSRPPDIPADLELEGGLYGVAIGGAFFGESMFSRRTDASKVCLVRLVEHLRDRGFVLLDVQFATPHLAQFGIEEIPRDEYLRRLDEAMGLGVTW